VTICWDARSRMTATAIVAVAGAISTPLVAIAGDVYNERRARADRSQVRDLDHGGRTSLRGC
jgi:hypothetical protein